MPRKPKQRYIVSYKEEHVDTKEAAEILDVQAANLEDALVALTTDDPDHQSDCIHFETIGASALPLTEKEVTRLEKDDRVVQVVEDIEVYALDHHRRMSSGGNQDGFMAGYRQAILDMAGGRAGFRQDGMPSSDGCPPGYCCVCRCEPIEEPSPPPPPPPERQPIPWNIELVKANLVWDRVTGQGVKVAIIDTGIDDDHPDLSVSGGESFVPGVDSWDDDQGHGTHVAGIVGARHNPIGVVGVAHQCSLYAVKVLAGNGSGQLSWILAGMEWARQNEMQVANLSLGSNVASADAACIVAYQRAAQALIDADCIVIAAAGNNGRSVSNPWVGQPARCPGYVAVAAVDQDRNLASFSSRGPEDLCAECGVEISAPGVSINSTYPGGGYRELSGTSMACPHVAGAAALLKELHPAWSPARIRERLKSAASDLGAPGNDPGTGAGLLDCERAVFGS